MFYNNIKMQGANNIQMLCICVYR